MLGSDDALRIVKGDLENLVTSAKSAGSNDKVFLTDMYIIRKPICRELWDVEYFVRKICRNFP